MQDLKAMLVLPPEANYRLMFSAKVDEFAATRRAAD
jgi:hypothetical protein